MVALASVCTVSKAPNRTHRADTTPNWGPRPRRPNHSKRTAIGGVRSTERMRYMSERALTCRWAGSQRWWAGEVLNPRNAQKRAQPCVAHLVKQRRPDHSSSVADVESSRSAGPASTGWAGRDEISQRSHRDYAGKDMSLRNRAARASRQARAQSSWHTRQRHWVAAAHRNSPEKMLSLPADSPRTRTSHQPALLAASHPGKVRFMT